MRNIGKKKMTVLLYSGYFLPSLIPDRSYQFVRRQKGVQESVIPCLFWFVGSYAVGVAFSTPLIVVNFLLTTSSNCDGKILLWADTICLPCLECWSFDITTRHLVRWVVGNDITASGGMSHIKESPLLYHVLRSAGPGNLDEQGVCSFRILSSERVREIGRTSCWYWRAWWAASEATASTALPSNTSSKSSRITISTFMNTVHGKGKVSQKGCQGSCRTNRGFCIDKWTTKMVNRVPSPGSLPCHQHEEISSSLNLCELLQYVVHEIITIMAPFVLPWKKDVTGSTGHSWKTFSSDSSCTEHYLNTITQTSEPPCSSTPYWCNADLDLLFAFYILGPKKKFMLVWLGSLTMIYPNDNYQTMVRLTTQWGSLTNRETAWAAAIPEYGSVIPN